MGDEVDKQIKTNILLQNPNKLLYESSYFCSIFPEEVWIAILKWVQLLLPEDLENWSNSSPYFRHLLRDQRTTFLFPKVFEILAPKYEKNYPRNRDELKDICYRDVPVPKMIHFDYLPNGELLLVDAHELTGIMKCRLVCPSWNRAIQHYYEDPKKPAGLVHFEMKYDRNRSQINETGKINVWKNRRFDQYLKAEYPQKFSEHFEETHHLKKNPFMGRSVVILTTLFRRRHMETGNEQIFLNGLDQVLTNFGEEVWYCKIELVLFDVSDLDKYRQLYFRLKGWLTLMPNLRTLKIHQIVQRCYGEKVPDFSKHDLASFEAEIRENPPPTLKHLEYLDLDNLIAPIFNQLIRQNAHISGLQIKKELPEQEAYQYDLDYLVSLLPNLKMLGIHSFTEQDLIKLENGCGALQLVKFQLTDPDGAPFHWGRLLGLVKGSSDTLTDLVLELPFVGDKKGMDLLQLSQREDVLKHLGDLEKLERLMVVFRYSHNTEPQQLMESILEQLEFMVSPKLQRVNVGAQTISLFSRETPQDKWDPWKCFKVMEMIKISTQAL